MQCDHPCIRHLKNSLDAIIAARAWPEYDSIVVDVFLVIQAANEKMQARRRMVERMSNRDDADQEFEEMPVWVPEA